MYKRQPLNKAALLSDEVADLVGLSGEQAIVSEALKTIFDLANPYASTSQYGRTKLTSSLSDSESLAVTPKAVKDVSNKIDELKIVTGTTSNGTTVNLGWRPTLVLLFWLYERYDTASFLILSGNSWIASTTRESTSGVSGYSGYDVITDTGFHTPGYSSNTYIDRWNTKNALPIGGGTIYYYAFK